MTIAGLILAGGRSSRFGQEKADAVLNGKHLIEHVLPILRLGTIAVAVSARPDSAAAAFAAAEGLDCLPDPQDGPSGPLSGILEGLRWAARIGAGGLVTAPCDTPFLPDDLISRLSGHSGCAVAMTEYGVQPLTALWPVTAADRLAHELAKGSHPAVQWMLRELGAGEIVFDAAWRFTNINTRADLDAAASQAYCDGNAKA